MSKSTGASAKSSVGSSATLGARVVRPADADVTVRAPPSLARLVVGDSRCCFWAFRIFRGAQEPIMQTGVETGASVAGSTFSDRRDELHVPKCQLEVRDSRSSSLRRRFVL